MSDAITLKQCKMLWAMCQNGNRNKNWFHDKTTGKISKGEASQLIQKWVNYITSTDGSPEETQFKISVEDAMQKYIPGFIVVSKPKDRTVNQEEVEGIVTDDVPGSNKGKSGSQPSEHNDPLPPPVGTKPAEVQVGDGEWGVDIEEIKRKKEEAEQQAKKRKEEEAEYNNTNRTKTVVVKTKGYIKPNIFDEAVAIIKAGKNLLLTGPAGCGKTRLTEEIAKVLKLEFFNKSFGGGQSYGNVFGGKEILPDGSTKWTPAHLLQYMEQEKHLINLDEPFSADADILLGLNSILEPNSRSFLTPNGPIQVHNTVRFTACSNTVGRVVSKQYVGATRTDDSLLDRFVALSMNYDLKVEQTLLNERISNNMVRNYFRTKLAALRDAVQVNNIAYDPSTRRLINCMDIYNGGLNKDRAFHCAFMATLTRNECTRLNIEL